MITLAALLTTLPLASHSRFARNPFFDSPQVIEPADFPDNDGYLLGWARWSQWSACSKSCGGGVQYQLRRCLDVRCSGPASRHRLCNTEICPGRTRSDAEIECELRDASWQPLPLLYGNSGSGNCSLVCRTTSGEVRDFQTSLPDGAACFREDTTTAACLRGKCQSVGCDLIIGSTVRGDQCGVCGGDGRSCGRTVFSWRDTQQFSPCDRSCGSERFQVSVSVCINTVNERVVPERLCADQKRPRPQVRPCPDVVCPAKWLATDWSTCSTSCGGGTQKREVFCVESSSVIENSVIRASESSQLPLLKTSLNGSTPLTPKTNETSIKLRRSIENRKVDDQYCVKLLKPDDKQSCGTNPCPAWVAETWETCSATCGTGIQRRNVNCLQGGKIVNALLCRSVVQPEDTQKCYMAANCDNYKELSSNDIKDRQNDASPVASNSFDRYRFVAESPFSQWNDARPGDGLQEEPARLLHGFPTSGDKTKPKFYPGVWSECSTSCGPGVRSRTVECVAFQGLTSNVMKLPDYECDNEPKPSLFQPCQNYACIAADPENLVLKASGANAAKTGSHYQWDYGEWGQCSATCLGGRQKSVLKCIDTMRKVSVPWSHCDAKQRPMDLFRDCNKGPCPPAWDVSAFGDCSHGCGGGIRTRKVRCIRRVAATGGAESTLILPDAQCAGDRPNHQEPCGLNDCAPAWRVDQWSTCSVSCGRGEQRRAVVCERRSAAGIVTVYDPPEACASAERPPTVQLCDLGSCDGTGYHSYDVLGSGTLVRQFSDASSRRSENLVHDNDNDGDKENFDQGQAAHRKLTLNVGGLANLYEGTSVKVKCPVKNFDRSRIVWTKDGETVTNNAHIKVSTNGALRIFHARMEDAGLYACFANGARGNVTLQFKPRDDASEDANRTRPLETNQIDDPTEPDDLSPTEVDLKLVEKVRLSLQKTGDYRFARVLQGIKSPGQLKVDFQTGAWASCSAYECGATDGTQVRLVKCRVTLIDNGDAAYVEDDVCDAFGAAHPPASKACKREDCPEWEASDWTECGESRCVRHHAALQRRDVKCVYPNGTLASNMDLCNRKTRPKIKKECVNSSCTAEWRPSIWGKCSTKRCATDPSKSVSGVQMRLLRCVWRGTKKAAGRHCDAATRPAAVRACSDGAEYACSTSLDKPQKGLLSDGTCEDKSRFCDIIKVFHSCDQPEIRERCCSSCRTDSRRLRHR